MGSFYTSHTVRGGSQPEILAWLGQRPALVSKTQRACTIVLDQACESQDSTVLADLGAELSDAFKCPVLALLNHDDDILYFELYEAGKKTDEYNSNPAYFGDDAESDRPSGGDAQRLCAVFGAASPDKIEAVLRGDYVFATERHSDLAEALGLPLYSVGVGYEYVSEGDVPPSASDANYIHTSG